MKMFPKNKRCTGFGLYSFFHIDAFITYGTILTKYPAVGILLIKAIPHKATGYVSTI